MQRMKMSDAVCQFIAKDPEKAIRGDDPILIMIGPNGQVIAGVPHSWTARFMTLDACIQSQGLSLDNYEMTTVDVGEIE